VNITNRLQPLALEDEEFDDERRLDDSQSDGENLGKEPQVSPRPSRRNWVENFQSMEKHDGSNAEADPKARTIGRTELTCDYYDRIDDHWRSIRSVGYQRAASALSQQIREFTAEEQALSLPLINGQFAETTRGMVWMNELRRLGNALFDRIDKVLQLLMQVYNIGLSQAFCWLGVGFKTLDHLSNYTELTLAQFDDFRTRMPREEAQQLENIVVQTLKEMDTTFQVTVGTSYRRSAKDSGDIDRIITKPVANLKSIPTVMLDSANTSTVCQRVSESSLEKNKQGHRYEMAWSLCASCIKLATPNRLSACAAARIWCRVNLLHGQLHLH